MEFDGRTALATGASRNIEREVPVKPVEQGADVDAVGPDRASFVTGRASHVDGGTYPTPTLASRGRS